MEEYGAAGKSAETIKATRRELERWGSWMKNLQPRPALEEVNADLIIRYLRGCGAYKAKATLSGTMSKLRCMGEFLVREGVWLSNPLRWLRGPKLDIRSRLPRRISPEVMAGCGRRQRHIATFITVRFGSRCCPFSMARGCGVATFAD